MKTITNQDNLAIIDLSYTFEKTILMPESASLKEAQEFRLRIASMALTPMDQIAAVYADVFSETLTDLSDPNATEQLDSLEVEGIV